MLRCLYGNKVIEIHVANGGTKNFQFTFSGDIKEVTYSVKKYKWALGLTAFELKVDKRELCNYFDAIRDNYTVVKRGYGLEFEASTSSDSVYMTIIDESDNAICIKKEITKHSNYIIDDQDALLKAKQNEKWIDTKGYNHYIEKKPQIMETKSRPISASRATQTSRVHPAPSMLPEPSEILALPAPPVLLALPAPPVLLALPAPPVQLALPAPPATPPLKKKKEKKKD